MAQKIRPNKIEQLEVNYHGAPVTQSTYKGKFTRDNIVKAAQRVSTKLNVTQNGMIEVALLYDKGWRSGYFTEFGTPVKLYHEDDYDDDIVNEPDHFREFIIYTIIKGEKAGGATNKFNDCLFDCLETVLLDKNPWKSAAALKKYLNVERNSKVDLIYIDKIEQKLKNYKI
jgi:hypothetical protein